MNLVDQAFGVHEKALMAHTMRAEVLARNISNSDTPGYKARDIDFQSIMAGAQQSLGKSLYKTDEQHLSVSFDTASDDLLYRVPLQESIDGNTVAAEVEQAAFAENAIRFQASTRFLDGAVKGLLLAIRGE